MWRNIVDRAVQLARDEEGATMVEYAIMLGLIAVVCVAAVGLIGTRTTELYTFEYPQ